MSLRPWIRSSLHTLNSLRTPRASRRRGSHREESVRPHLAEALEKRVMLTTVTNIVGEETIFEYSPLPQTLVRMRISGNVQMELLGAIVSGRDNRARVTNVGGRLFKPNQPGVPPVDIAGGIGGPGSIDIIGDVFSPGGGNINALAAHPVTGELYGFDVQQIPIQNPPPGSPQFITNVFLVNLSFPATPPGPPYGPGPANTIGVNGTVVADLTTALQGAGQFNPVAVSVAAADFNPINGLLYFVVRSGEAGIDQMFTVDVNAGSVPGSVNAIPGNFNDAVDNGIQVASIAFDQTGPSSARLIAVVGEDTGGGGAGGGGGNQAISANPATFRIVNPANTNNTIGGIPFTVPGDDTDDITVTGIEVINDNPTQIDSLLVVGPGEHWALMQNDPVAPNGLLLELGQLAEPLTPPGDPDPPDTWEGSVGDASGVTFVPTLFDPFTQQLGAFVGYELGDEDSPGRLFFINPLESGNPEIARTIFQIYIANADLTAQISIAEVDLNDDQRREQPYGSFRPSLNTTALQVFNAQNGQDIDVTPGSNVGLVFVGAVTRDLNPNTTVEERRPLLEALLEPGIGIGLLPGNTLQIDPQTGLPLVPAGLTVANGDLDRFLLDGTLTGRVEAAGSINQMYVGWLLTGDARGELEGISPTRPQNFRVLGDLRDLYVLDSIGTNTLPAAGTVDPTYMTGTDIDIGGSLGSIKVGDAWLGNTRVQNEPGNTRRIATPQIELERRTDPTASHPATLFSQFQFAGFPAGNATYFHNDTFDTPQLLGAIQSLGQEDMVRVVGDLQHTDQNSLNDWADYYGVALMAGQTIQVQLLSSFGPGLPYVGVFDPDGRLIATDASDVTTPTGATGFGEVFQITTDRPGIYRFAIAMPLNYQFNGLVRQDGSNIPSAPYELRVTGVGDIAYGGLFVQTGFLDTTPSNQLSSTFEIGFGDFGAFRVGGAMASYAGALGGISNSTIRVLNGNLRAIDADQIGFGTRGTAGDPANPADPGTAAALNAPINVDVPGGSIGLLRARNPAGVLFWNFSATLEGRPSIGGDYQLIDAFGSCYVEAIADGGLGVLRAGDMNTTVASTITVNFDNVGNDGIIDLIDVTGQFGSLAGGGPGITTNTGGNVRFIRVGGVAFTDIAFGGGFGTPIRTQHLSGETVSLIDDSGSTMNLIPMSRFTTAGTPIGTPDFLQVRSYGIRGSGGVVLMDVRANDTFTIQGTGNNPDATVEIGRIIIQAGSIGPGVVTDFSLNGPAFPNPADFGTGFEPINPGFGGDLGEGDYRRTPNPFVFQNPSLGLPGAVDALEPGGEPGDLDIILDGSSKIDVWDIVAADGPSLTDGKLSSIRNNTQNGELINIRAASVGEIVSRGTIGVAKSTVVPGLTLQPLAYYDDEGGGGDGAPFPGTAGAATTDTIPGYARFYGATNVGQFPYIDQRYGVWITGDLDQNPGTGTSSAELLLTPPEPGNVRSIRAGQGVGNIVVNGSIGELIANDGGTREDGVFAGIQGIVWARGHSDLLNHQNTRALGVGYTNAFEDRGGDIWYVDIGEGVAASGSGSAIRSGIYAARHIDHVFGENADIRGNIIAGDEFENPRNRVPATGGNQLPGQGDPSGIRPQFVPNVFDFPDSIRLVQLRNGSIINANIGVVGSTLTSVEQSLRIALPEDDEPINNPEFELGRVIVSGNGGIIGTSFQGADIGLIDVNGGFGIFTSELLLGGTGVLGGIEADNYGLRNVLGNVGGSMQFLNARGDGSSRSTVGFSPSVRRSEMGFVGVNADPLTGFANNALTDIHVVLGTSAATPEIPGRTDTGILEDVDFRGQRDFGNVRAQQIRATNPELLPSVLNFAGSFGTLQVRDQINGLKMTTGKFGNFKPAGDVFNLDLTVAGPLKALTINGDLAGTSVIRTQGKVGNMGNIRINGRLDGDILASGKIKRLFVAESISGNISAMGGKGNAVNQLIIGGDIAEGGLNIQGSLGKLKLGGDFGRTGTDFVVQGKLGSLIVAGNLYSNVRVGSKLGKLSVGGSIFSGVRVEGRPIGSVRVGGDVQPDVIFTSTKQPKIKTGGQMLGDVVIVP